MGYGSLQSKDKVYTDTPPKGARIIGDGGKVTRYGEEAEETKDQAAATSESKPKGERK